MFGVVGRSFALAHDVWRGGKRTSKGRCFLVLSNARPEGSLGPLVSEQANDMTTMATTRVRGQEEDVLFVTVFHKWAMVMDGKAGRAWWSRRTPLPATLWARWRGQAQSNLTSTRRGRTECLPAFLP